MELQVIVTKKESNEVNNISFDVKDKVTVGRHLDSPVVLQGEGLSRHHFSLSEEAGELKVEDLSSNGTWLNGKLMSAQHPTRVKSGDVVEVPGYRMQLMLPNRHDVTRYATGSANGNLPLKAKPAWAAPILATLGFFSGGELLLLAIAAFTAVLVSFYFSR